MNFLSLQECQNWCLEHKYKLVRREIYTKKLMPFSLRQTFSLESRHVAHLAKLISNNSICKKGALLWITEYGIWPSEENRPFFDKIRSAFGEERPLQEAPGFYFDELELNMLSGFIRLAVSFGWGGYTLSPVAEGCVFFSHDEWFEVRSVKPIVQQDWSFG